MDKLVNIYPSKPIIQINPPIRCIVKRVVMPEEYIKICINNGATVEEVIDDNNTIILNSTNYNKDNSIKESVTIVDEITDSSALDTTNSSEETETTEDKIVDIYKKIESKKYNKKNKYKNRSNQDNISGENT